MSHGLETKNKFYFYFELLHYSTTGRIDTLALKNLNTHDLFYSNINRQIAY